MARLLFILNDLDGRKAPSGKGYLCDRISRISNRAPEAYAHAVDNGRGSKRNLGVGGGEGRKPSSALTPNPPSPTLFPRLLPVHVIGP